MTSRVLTEQYLRRLTAAGKIGCGYEYLTRRGHGGERHRITRAGRLLARGRTFNDAMRQALAFLFSDTEPLVPRDELLVG